MKCALSECLCPPPAGVWCVWWMDPSGTMIVQLFLYRGVCVLVQFFPVPHFSSPSVVGRVMRGLFLLIDVIDFGPEMIADLCSLPSFATISFHPPTRRRPAGL